jgi:biopolymer transport protein ExbB
MTRSMPRSFFAALALAVGLVAVTLAQDAAPAFKEKIAPKPKDPTLLDLYKVGGPVMHPLLLCSVAAVTLIIINALALRERKVLRPELVPQLQELLIAGDIEGVKAVCANQEGILPPVVAAGMELVTGGPVKADAVREAMEEAATEQMVTYLRPINYLSVVGTVSPMLGLLGTVTGMISAFQHIGAGGMGKPEELAGDIGEALITTAAGLIIAIPAMLCYFYFKNNFMKMMASLGRETGSLINRLPAEIQYYEEPAAPAGGEPAEAAPGAG